MAVWISHKVLTFFLWIFYVILSEGLSNPRSRYMMGQQKGMNCYKVKSGLFSDTFYYEPSPPERDYLTFKEFFKEQEKRFKEKFYNPQH